MTKSQLSNFEKRLLENPIEPEIVERQDYGYKLNYNLSEKISTTLNKIKGRIDEEIGETGDLEIEEYIDFRIKQDTGIADNFDIFKETFEANGLDVYLLIDCSGSMRGLEQKMADVTATIMHAMKKCSFINFKTIAFSAKPHEFKGVNDYITDYTQAGRIHADRNDYHDLQMLAIDQARRELSESENKKMIILLTDGYPECGVYEATSEILQSLMVRSVTQAENQGIECFCIYYGHISSTDNNMKKIFGNKLYTTSNFYDVEEKLVEKLRISVENLNQGGFK